MPHLRLLVIALLITPVALLAQAGTGSVDGVVLRLPNNEPLARASVDLRSLDPGPARFYSIVTEGDGRFTFRGLAPGRYQLTPMRGGYVRGDFGLRGPGASGVTIVLSAGQRVTGVTLTMKPTGTIAGRITDRQGEPVGNAHVRALRFSYQDGRPALTNVKSVFTNDLGEYRLGWLPPGLYNVSAQHPDGSNGTPLTQPEILNSSTFPNTAVINAGGFNGGSFNSTGNGDPANRARIGLADGESYPPVYAPGTFDHRTAAVFDVRSGSETTGVDIAISPLRLGSITGTLIVRSPSASALLSRPGVQVQVSRNPTFSSSATPSRVDGTTGTFRVTGLTPGSYVLTASLAERDVRVSGHTVVEIGEGGLVEADLALEPGVDIPVTVAFDSAVAQKAAGQLRVSLRTTPVIPQIAETTAAAPGADGSALIRSVIPGSYIVNVAPLMKLGAVTPPPGPRPAVPGPPQSSGLPSDWEVTNTATPAAYVKAVRLGSIDVLNDGLMVENRAPDQVLQIVIGGNPGHVTGVVADRGRPAGHAVVVLVPNRRHRQDLYRVAVAGPDGRFRLTNVAPDDYKLFAWEDVETGSWLGAAFMQLYEGEGKALRISEGMSVTTDLTLAREH